VRIYPGQAEWKAVEQHLDRLLEMDETQWDDYLSALESDEPTVVAALREMMADRRNLEPQGFLETSLISPPDQERVGTQVGAYTIVSPIGRGGMGEVWLAQRSDGRFEGKFALKFLETYSSSPAALDRFQREGRLLARLAHPHIARLIDAGVTASGSPYLILEYVQGIRIDEYCATHRMTVEARVRLILDVLRALALVSGLCSDFNRGKGPILRGLAARAPYFHNGAAANLNELINFYNLRFQMNLTQEQKRQLAAFLNSL
jgi:hypothetical protein